MKGSISSGVFAPSSLRRASRQKSGCSQIDAFIGGLRREHHGDQKLEGVFVIEFTLRLGAFGLEPLHVDDEFVRSQLDLTIS